MKILLTFLYICTVLLLPGRTFPQDSAGDTNHIRAVSAAEKKHSITISNPFRTGPDTNLNFNSSFKKEPSKFSGELSLKKIHANKDLFLKKNEYKPYESEHHLAISLIEMALIQYLPFAASKYLREWGPEETNWTKVSWNTWRRNLREGFEYDGDNFITNHFAHPYHGSAFFNAGRTNGYNFWESSLYAFLGAGVWEMFAETFRPSFNDLVNTAVNGVNFGETLYKLSNMITDNKANGFERVWREAVGGIINPVRGVNRLISGEAFRIFENPEYSRPEKFLIKLSAGMRRVNESDDGTLQILSKGTEQGTYSMDVTYGDLFNTRAPFSHFTFGAEFTTGIPQFASLYSSGYLTGFPMPSIKGVRHKVNITLDYSYTNNPGFQYGQTSIIPNFLSQVDISDNIKLLTMIGLNGILMGGTDTDYFIGEDGRDYDMGPGLGGVGTIEITYKNWSYVKIYFTNGWIYSMTEPQEAIHNINTIFLQFNLPLQSYFAVGFDLSIAFRNSYYKDSPDVKRQVGIAKLYFSTFL